MELRVTTHCNRIVCRYKLKNIEETEAAKKLLQEKRLTNRTKTDSRLPSSFSADYSERGKEYAEKLRRGILFNVPFDTFIFINNDVVF